MKIKQTHLATNSDVRLILDAVLKQGGMRLFQHGFVRLGTPLF